MVRSSRARSLVLAVAAAGLIAGCGGGGSSGGGAPAASGGGTTPAVTPSAAATLFADDFQSVCQGATETAATPYDKTAAAHMALYFETFTDDLLDESSNDLPTDWTIQYSASDPTAYSAVDLVACGVRTTSKLVNTCTGYKDDSGKTLDSTLQLYSATYTLSVHEATTGKTLSSTTVSSNDNTCPEFASFDAGEKTAKQYDSIPKAKVVAALKPFVQP